MDVLQKITTNNYKLTLEEIEGNIFCHLEVYIWKLSTYKQMILDLEQIKKALGVPMWCNINKQDADIIKLVAMFGFLPAYETNTTYIMEAV